MPVVRNIQDKTPDELRAAIAAQKDAAHQRSITPEDLRDFTLMLSNFGTLAGRYGIPLVVPPAVAILGAGKVRAGCGGGRGRRRGASAHAAVVELRSPLHHRRRGVPISGRRHRAISKIRTNREDTTMHQASPEQYRKIVAAIVAAAARLPKSVRGTDRKRFLQAYYANVDAEDMAGARSGGARGERPCRT